MRIEQPDPSPEFQKSGSQVQHRIFNAWREMAIWVLTLVAIITLSLAILISSWLH
ncbi:hypothetical protein [Chelativorans sp. M5D2P16]|uniref:hypothetical protein n=1 Tax=Chelativorans sp. M5D2P16 TaxID=3095678 RepID=UPI002ACAAC73|nr:hypothetical protein [Chelativorans sp. M5D2P16]MDZ5697831.1 hypothetical protein [Chelativorans sp. M5D2P16]